MRNETWRDIPNWEGYYQASDQGRVRSLPRTVRSARPGGRQRVSGRIMRPILRRSDGRYMVNLSRAGMQAPYDVHVLVAQTFLGPRPPGMFVCHNSPDHHDNRVANLRYDTPRENVLDTVRHGTNRNANKTHCPQRHPYSGGNLIARQRNGRTSRECRECQRQRKRHGRAKVSA